MFGDVVVVQCWLVGNVNVGGDVLKILELRLVDAVGCESLTILDLGDKRKMRRAVQLDSISTPYSCSRFRSYIPLCRAPRSRSSASCPNP